MTTSDPIAPSADRWWDRAAAVVIGIGAALRLVAYLDRRPLWADEALPALSVATRGFLDLVGPLERFVIAPVPFLWASRAAVGILGVNESAFRLVPLLAGLALLVVLWRLARRLLGPPEGLFAVTLAAVSPLLIYYSSEFKQYGIDALVAALVVAESVRFLESAGERSWKRLCVVGAAALLCSQPAVFILAGTGAALLAHPDTRSRPANLAPVFLCWALVFIALYLTTYAPSEGHAVVQQHWESTFLRPGAADLGARIRDAAQRLLVLPLVSSPASLPVGIVALAFVAGLSAVVRRRGWVMGLLIGMPFVAVAGAAMLGLYPPIQRLLLFLAPLTFLALAGLVSLIRGRNPSARRTAVAGVLTAAPVALNAWPLLVFLFAPGPAWNARTLIASLPPNETVYVAASGVRQWAFYTTDWDQPDRRRLSELFEVMSQGGGAPERSWRIASCEGDELTRRYGDRREILGLPTGIEYVERVGYTRDAPDPRWADREAQRIRAAGDSVVWVFTARQDPVGAAMLRSRLIRGGGRVVEERIQDRWHRASAAGPGNRELAAAYRVVFSGPAQPNPCPAQPVEGRPAAPSRGGSS